MTSPINGPRGKITCRQGFVKNKGADLPALQRSLISALIIRFLESIIAWLAKSKTAIFSLSQ